MGLHKIMKVLMAILGVAGLVLSIVIFSTLDDEALKDEVKAVGIQAMEVPQTINWIMMIAYVVLAISIVLVVIFVLKGLASGNAKNTLIGVGAFLLVIAISYLLASGVETPLKDGKVLSANGSRWVSAGLNAFFILAAVAIGSMLFGGVRKMIKG